ncbi:MAG: sodium:calcium antiporter [Promethearchaeota archaeon]
MDVLFLAIIILIAGIVLIIFSSDIAVKHSATLAGALGVSSLVIGITIVSIGTDISEIFNSIISCSLGHGDIDVGDSVGSDLTQLTLIFGLLPIICGTFKVKRKEFIIIGSCEILSLILIFTVVEKGYFTRLDAIFMMGSFIFYTMIVYNVTKSDRMDSVDLIMESIEKRKSKKYHLLLASLGFLGVAISSYAIIQSVITISSAFNVHEYIISFFLVSIGTSLPELAVDINALRRKKYNIAIGDILGSCIVDSTLSIGIGQALFPQAITAELAIPTILYTLFVSVIVIFIVAKREKMDKKSGILFISLYFFSYVVLFSFWTQV